MQSNNYRVTVASADRDRKAQSGIDARIRAGNHFEKPVKAINHPSTTTLCDWVADNPDFKKSRAYNRLMDAYYESLQHSIR